MAYSGALPAWLGRIRWTSESGAEPVMPVWLLRRARPAYVDGDGHPDPECAWSTDGRPRAPGREGHRARVRVPGRACAGARAASGPRAGKRGLLDRRFLPGKRGLGSRWKAFDSTPHVPNSHLLPEAG